jgi:hypothetical protein
MTSRDPPKQPPIEPQDYLGGVTVVDIGDIRVARGMSRRPSSSCKHCRLHYDRQERRIWCSDCEQDIEAFDAFERIVEQFSDAERKLKTRASELSEAERFQIRTLAARQIDIAWRSRTMVPACPTCGCGLFPEDFKSGIKVKLGREYAEAQRKKKLERS